MCGNDLVRVCQKKVGREAATDPSRTFRFKVTKAVPNKNIANLATTAKLTSLSKGFKIPCSNMMSQIKKNRAIA